MDLLNEIKEIWSEHILRRKVGYVQPDSLEEQEDQDPFTYQYGKLSLVKPTKGIKKGENVLTPDGIGECHITFPWRGPAMMNQKRVEVWLKRKYYKAYPVEDVYQYMIRNDALDCYIALSNSCYRYILDANDIVKYRTTGRGYAMLADSEKEKREWIKIFNDRRGGRSILKTLLKSGYIIVKNKS
jgi:hypothetical protein